MTILALTDIHSAYSAMESICASVSAVDVVVLGGDVTTYGAPDELEDGVGKAKKHAKHVVAVCGNMDPPALERVLDSQGVSINGRGLVIEDVGFFGVSAAPFSILNTPYEIAEEEIQRRAEAGWRDVRDARWKIFVPHAPPVDTALDQIRSGKHVGSKAVREFIERRQPHAALCGHIHEARGKDQIGSTVIVNCGPAKEGYYAVVEVNDMLRIGLKP